MEHNLFPPTLPFLAIVIFILIYLPTSLCADNERYAICSSSYKCGNISITYPFFTTWNRERPNGDRPYYCGAYYLGFELHCRDDQILTMNMTGITYRVLAINDSTQTVTVARNDLWDSYCPTTYLNTTIDSQFFQYSYGLYSSVPVIYMYYGCPSNITNYANQQFTCVINTTNTTLGYYEPKFSYNSDFSTAMIDCNFSVSIPASKSALQTLSGSPSRENLIAAINGGFELVWDANNPLCSACVDSGGQCGINTTSTEKEFNCYCPDKPYPVVCGPNRGSQGSSSSLDITRKLAIGGKEQRMIKTWMHL